MACSLLPKMVVVVSGTHWHCVTCNINHKRTVSLDQHLIQKHPYVPLPPPDILTTEAHTLSDGEEYEDVEKEKGAIDRYNRQAEKPSQWLNKLDFDSSDNVDNNSDGDFVPSELENKAVRSKVNKKSRRKTVRKRSKQMKSRGLQKEQVTGPEPMHTVSKPKQEIVSEYEPPTESELSEPEDDNDEDFKPKRDSGRRKHTQPSTLELQTKRRKQKTSEALITEKQSPRKRGRPPKPKPSPPEEEDLPPKRPYRKRVPDPSELLLKLRNVGRKPNTRKKMSAEERDATKAQFVKYISKGSTLLDKDVEQNQKISADDCRSVLEGNAHDSGRQAEGQDSASTGGAEPVESVSQQEDVSSTEKIRCTVCLCVFGSGKALKEHLSKVCNEDIVQCLACEMKFHGIMDLNMHVFCDHEYEKQPACFFCSEDFVSMEKLEKHLSCWHKEEPELKLSDTRFHDCRLCRMELNVDFQLIKNHYYRRHKAYVCPECYGKDVELLYYTDTHLYGEHKQMHAKSPAECAICGMMFPTAREMKAHMWAHANDMTDDGTGGKCSKCDKYLPNSGAMLMHEKEHKNEAIRKNYALEASIGFPCMKCEHIFSSKSNLKKHSCKADPNRTYYYHCEYCAHGCNTKEQLRDHIALHHLGIKRYACDFCDQRFVCAPTLRRHIRRVHTKEKPYECHICKERFFERNLMLRHVSKHTGIASFMCEFCGKGFHTKFDLKKHVENHTDSRDFVCPNCGLDYKRSYHLKRHVEKGCKKKFPHAMDGKAPTAVSKVPVAAHEDADEMVYLDLAREINIEDDDNDADMDNYSDESSGPDFGEDVEDDAD